MNKKSVVIVAAKRTALGSFQGQFSSLSASDLGSYAISAAIEDSHIEPTQVDSVHMGCVLPAGQGQAPARQASLKAGLPLSVPCNTVNKMCGSGMQAVMYGYNQILAGDANCVVAGGMESMTNAPYLSANLRGGLKMGHSEMIDHMFHDGLQDVKHGKLMGSFAELCAEKYGFTREQQDDFAITSLQRANAATQSTAFESEITPVVVKNRKAETRYATDEQPAKADLNKIKTLRPAFKKDGTVTAANASSISDGAAALVLMDVDEARKQGLQALATITAQAVHAQDPDWFSTAPIVAIQKVLEKSGWAINDVDLFEINEAFAVVTMAAIETLNLDPDKVNVNGGACALGHPIGASGARVLVTLIHALKARQLTKGVATLCIGGGEATAMAIEII
ncbi:MULTISPECIES: thiolase family protein [Cycloclasticus]|uniref:Acetyl-coa acetyltransferase protein n=1 Tax=Cycloclasticus pugetii TaxID=34068 RepID=A0AB33Z2F7_9GAMM|nr:MULTISPECIES: thiolase family protein [Cycloclasticus]ATI03122.1 acetyl-CoA C-acyltransferase [Cycloclasticus sp. PY97N]EPD13396.1 acetyl-coa acetyltransferase protein [Cycloclasticus pugetii]